ncbi:Hypothetical predicted protein [Pelobates cultripes]|uniref:Uncharacterized protein n=1 Tax=Pelobates cultripes TaxID=61616 RepID=A0AAD1RAE9_PELCU|nr:Hypothetical predicted protein [Pelobates cultripes]
MSKGVDQMTERILNLTLEVIYLLTGEDYVVVKNQGDRMGNDRSSRVSDRFCRSQNPFTDHPNYSQERNSDEKVLELANTVIHLLTGEVLSRCKKVTFGFSMGDIDYFEEHKDPYQNLMMDKQQALCSLGNQAFVVNQILNAFRENGSPTPNLCMEQY